MPASTKLFHVGIVLDGNRRWAQARGLPSIEGHQQGAENFKEIALKAFSKGVTHLSAFVFSTENWSRTKEEVGYLMKLVVKATEKYLEDFHRANVKILVMGERGKLENSVLQAIERTETKTAGNTGGNLVLCFNYGGQQEIVHATREIIRQHIPATLVNAETIAANLYLPEVPPLDLMIRTSGEQRTSGFLLWRATYSELAFSDKLWPDFTEQDLDTILADYRKRNRRFGE